LQSEGAIVIDTRPSNQFAAAHVPGSIHIALTGQYASWAARLLGLDTPLIIVGEDPDSVRESQLRLARVGIESVAGYLEDGIAGWARSGLSLESIPQIAATDFADLLNAEPDRIAVLDVRETSELEAGAIESSVHIPLAKLKARTAELNSEKLIVVLCRSGYRSSIATSILRHAGISDIANLLGGLDAWKAAGLPCALPGPAAV